MYVIRNIEARSCSHCRNGESIIITYSDCVCSLIQNALHMRHIFIRGLPTYTVSFHIISHKRHDFRKNVIEHKMCFDIL